MFLIFYPMNKYIFQICLEIELNDHHYLENGVICKLHCIVASPFCQVVVCLSMTHSATQTKVHTNMRSPLIAVNSFSHFANQIEQKSSALETVANGNALHNSS